MPDRADWLDVLSADVAFDTALSRSEKERREGILRDIATRVTQDGEYRARSHSDRARQFMPFAALKGYHDLAHQREHVSEPKQIMTDERALELSQLISGLSKGVMVAVTHYEDDGYTTTHGLITEINETFRTLRIIRQNIAFDDITSIEVMS